MSCLEVILTSMAAGYYRCYRFILLLVIVTISSICVCLTAYCSCSWYRLSFLLIIAYDAQVKLRWLHRGHRRSRCRLRRSRRGHSVLLAFRLARQVWQTE